MGVDISDFSIEVLLLGGKKEILKYDRVELKKGIIENGRIINKEILAEKLKEAIRGRGARVIASLPESKTFIHLIELDSGLEGEELEKAVREEAMKIVPLSPAESYWDFYIAGFSSQNRQKILYAGAEKELVDEYLEVFSMAGLEPEIFDLESASLGRALIPAKDYFSKLRQKEGINESSLIMDIGARTCNVSVFNYGGILVLSTIIPIGGNDFTNAIAEKLKIGADEAEKIKKGLGENDARTKEILSILKKKFQEIIVQTKEIIKNYEEQFGENIDKVILTGGSSLLPKLDEFFSVNINKKVFVGDPLKNINTGNLFKKNISPAIFANVIGLAFRGVGKREEGINLLRQVKSKTIKKAPKKIIIAAFAAFAILIAVSSYFVFKPDITDNNIGAEPSVSVSLPEETGALPVITEEKPEPAKEKKAEIKDTPTGWLNVREGAGTSYPKITRVYPGETYIFLEEKDGWYKIKLNNGKEGWITSEFASLEEDAP